MAKAPAVPALGLFHDLGEGEDLPGTGRGQVGLLVLVSIILRQGDVGDAHASSWRRAAGLIKPELKIARQTSSSSWTAPMTSRMPVVVSWNSRLSAGERISLSAERCIDGTRLPLRAWRSDRRRSVRSSSFLRKPSGRRALSPVRWRAKRVVESHVTPTSASMLELSKSCMVQLRELEVRDVMLKGHASMSATG